MFRKNDDRHEFMPLLVEIEEAPLNPLGRFIFWIIILAILFLSLWMAFGRVDVVVTARGKVIPVGEVKTVQPLNAGVVRNIFVKPGDYVEKGQILMEIDPSDIDPELASMQQDLKQVELEIVRIESLLKGIVFAPSPALYDAGLIQVQLDFHASVKERLEKQIRVKKETLVQVEERLAAERTLSQQAKYLLDLASQRLSRLGTVRDIISRDDYDNAGSDCKKYGSELESSGHRIEELLAQRAQVGEEIQLIEAEERNRLLTELSENKQKYLYLKARIEKTEFISTRQQITSPVDGYVAQLLFNTIGGVVTPAEKLAHIVPKDSPLVVKALIMNRDMGFVTGGMEASIKVDAYDFQKYGTLDGRVLQISKDSIEDKNLGLVYEAYVSPLKTTLVVDGKETPLSTGMSVTAEVRVGKRRIIEFFIYPLIKYLDEGISVR